jgi:hypothetical protein
VGHYCIGGNNEANEAQEGELKRVTQERDILKEAAVFSTGSLSELLTQLC